MDVGEFVQGFVIGVLLGGIIVWAIYRSWSRPGS